MKGLQSPVQVIIQIIPAQLLFKLINACILIDQQEFDACDFCKIAQVFGRDRVAKACMVCAARIDPGCCSDL